MSYNPYGSLNTIEYIGPRPQKPKKNFFGGWVILVISVAMALVFGRPLLASLKSEQVTGTQAAADSIMEELSENATASQSVSSESAVNNSAELLLKAYQNALGINVKDLLHEDMTNAFSQYPQLWYERGPNKEIDASRVQNIQRFFHRSGDDFRTSDPLVGDVIFWTLPDGNAHAAIIVPGPGLHSNEKWIVHHWQGSVVWENKLNDFIMPLGRYRFGQ
jgi:uncharacterized protein YijF (DUF1287 family)